MKLNYIPSNTEEWRKEKAGLFSSSGIVALFKGGTRPMTKAEIEAKKIQDKKDKANNIETNSRRTVDLLLGQGANTYINEKVSENINGRMKETPVTKLMERGLILEPDALNLFKIITGIKMHPSGLFKMPEYNCGGTPDGIAFNKKGKIIAIAEIKCLNEDRHSEICDFIGSMANQVKLLREYDESFFCQCQMNMFVTNCKTAYFISYDNRPMGYKDDSTPIEELFNPGNWPYCIKIIKIKRDEAFIDELKHRLTKAYEIFISKKISRIRQAKKMIVLAEKTKNKLIAA